MDGDRRRRWLWPALALLLVIAGAWLLLGRSRGGGAAAGGSQAPAARPTEGPGGSGASPGADPVAQATSPSEAKLVDVLAQYRKDAVYPPWSRPLDAGSGYKLKWNEALTDDLPFVEKAGQKLVYRFGADRHFVTFGQPYTSWIEVSEAGAPKKRVPVVVKQAWVMTTSGQQQGRTVRLTYHDDGLDGDAVAGDLRYSNRFVPSEHDELAHAEQVRIMAEVEAVGETRQMIRDFAYTPRPVLDVKKLSDAIEDGSLVVTADVEVFEDGLYTFEANLVTGGPGDEVPIAYIDQSQQLAAGKQRVKLVFFGRVIHDKGFAGPYLVRDLRGFRRPVDGSEANLWWSYEDTYLTKAYKLDELSPAEWDAPEKREKIQSMERLIQETRAGTIGGPGGRSPTIVVGPNDVPPLPPPPDASSPGPGAPPPPPGASRP
jgi:hypothetical protein